MVHIQQSLVLSANANDVWSVVGDFDKINEWHPAVLTIEDDDDDEGHIRLLGLLGGTKKMKERLIELNEDDLTYSYTIEDGPLPVQEFTGTVSVDASNEETGSSIFTWVAEFEPKDTTEEDATAIITGYFATGLKGLKKIFDERNG